MHTLPQSFRNSRATSATSLSCAARVHAKEVASGTFSLVRNLFNELSPSGIINRLGQHCTCQAANVQVFDSDCAVVSNQPLANLMMKIRSLVANVSVRSLQKQHGFPATIATLLPSRHSALRSAKLSLRLAVIAWIRNLRSVAQGGKGGKPHINSDAFIAREQRLCVALDGEASKPTSSFALDRQGLNHALNRSMQPDLNQTDALQSQLAIIQHAAAVAVRRKRDAVKTGVRLETRVTGLQAAPDAEEESLERLINSPQDILTSGEVRKVQVFVRANLFKLVGLLVVIDALTVDATRIAAFLERSIVKPACFAKLRLKQVSLCASRIQTILESLSQLSALLRFDVLAHCAFGDVPDRAAVVASAPKARQDAPEKVELLTQDAGSVAFELRHDMRHGKGRVAFNDKVYVVRHHLHRMYHCTHLLRLLGKQFFQAVCDVVNQYRAPILRAENDVIFEGVNCASVLSVACVNHREDYRTAVDTLQ